MAVKIGINGFGRIGRYLTRLLADDRDLDLAVVNARGDNQQLAHLLKYDSVHGKFKHPVEANLDGFNVGCKHVRITRNLPDEWVWGEEGCDIVVESTGKFNDRDGCEKHLAAGAKKVVVSAPAKGEDVTIVIGVNDDEYKPEHKIISNASCTTNCLAPVAKLLNDAYGIKHGLMTTIHSYTMSQRVLDGTCKDWRRGRACGMSMVPTTTGAARAVTKVIPALAGKLDGMAVRVPTPNVSLVDLTCELEKSTTTEELLATLKAAANESMGCSEEPLVSVDYVGDTHGGVIDIPSCQVLDGTMAKLIIWYDNESGFTNQLLRLIRMVAKSL